MGSLPENLPKDGPDGGLSESVYSHLRAIAQNRLAQERPGHTLQATALVHEAYMRLAAGGGPPRPGPEFYWAAAEAMRRILIEHARARKAAKRGGGAARLDWSGISPNLEGVPNLDDPDEIEGLDASILRLQEKDPRAADVVRLRFYAGLSVEEAARALSISSRSAKRDWEYARAWLLRELGARSRTA
jgi:RNA polymerase sigma factor (TIGR02999 family)